MWLLIPNWFSEVSNECPICLLRSLLYGLSRRSAYLSPAQSLGSPFSSKSCSCCSMLGFEESHPEHVQSIDKPRILREFPYSLLFPILPGSFSGNLLHTFKAFSPPKLQFLLPQLKTTQGAICFTFQFQG